MRIALVSDAHGDTRTLDKLLRHLPPVDAFCFLGDCMSDAQYLEAGLIKRMPNATFAMVTGNNDWGVPPVHSLTVDYPVGRALLTHGHLYRVKQTYALLAEHARHAGAMAAFFGHTHIPYTGWHQGVLLINPGAANGRYHGGTYAIVEWTKDRIAPEIVRIP